MTSEVDVVVIGAGAAGLGAARTLCDHGLECLVIEARDRIGGRALTVESGFGGPLDLGCGWLHSGDRNPWTTIAETAGRHVDRTPPPWQRPPLAISMSPSEHDDFQQANARFHDRLEAIAADGSDRPVSDALLPGDRWNGLLTAVSSYISGAEPPLISARDLYAYEDSGVNWRVADGYGALIADHGRGLPVALNCPATLIDHSGRRIVIDTPRGAISAKAAIVTIPSALIADGAIAFFPALPEKIAAARGLPLGLADKLYLALDGAEEFDPDVRVFGGTDRAATASYQFRPLSRPVIEAYFGGAFADELETGGEASFFEVARAELGAIFGSDFPARIRPLAMHRWRADPFARGSYSYAVPGQVDDRSRLAEPIDDRLFFAGEACSPRSYSTAHGALETGIAAAQAVIAASARW